MCFSNNDDECKHLTHWQQSDISQAWWGIDNVCGVESVKFNEFIKAYIKTFIICVRNIF